MLTDDVLIHSLTFNDYSLLRKSNYQRGSGTEVVDSVSNLCTFFIISREDFKPIENFTISMQVSGRRHATVMALTVPCMPTVFGEGHIPLTN